jgi:hypothetical protein
MVTQKVQHALRAQAASPQTSNADCCYEMQMCNNGAQKQFQPGGAAGGEAHATPPFGQARAGAGDVVLELSATDAASQPKARANAPNELSRDLMDTKKTAVAQCRRLVRCGRWPMP